MTRTLARQMSAPVPSPSIKGMIGLSGTTSVPSLIVILAPWAGGVTLGVAGVDTGVLLKGRAGCAGRARHASTRVSGRAARAPRGTRMRDSPLRVRAGDRDTKERM